MKELSDEQLHVLSLAYQNGARQQAFGRGEIAEFEAEHGKLWEQPKSPYEWAMCYAIIFFAGEKFESADRLRKAAETASKTEHMDMAGFAAWMSANGE